MRTFATVAVVVLGMVASSHADVSKADEAAHFFLASQLLHASGGPVRFGFSPGGLTGRSDLDGGSGAEYLTRASRPVLAIGAAEPTVAWFATDLELYPDCFTEADCKGKNKPDSTLHATIVIERSKDEGTWSARTWHVASLFTAKAQAEAIAGDRATPAAVPGKIDKGAEAVVRQFEATLGDPKALAASVATRKDVVLYGSERAERWVGGAAVKAQLAKWNLAFKVRDGIQAGISGGKTVVWVAANVDATSRKRPKAKPVPYRAMFLYERTKAGAWQLVQAHFSFVENLVY